MNQSTLNLNLSTDGKCYGLCLDGSAKPHVVRGGTFTEMVVSRMCDATVDSW